MAIRLLRCVPYQKNDPFELYDLVFALEGGDETIIIRETNTIITELFRDSGVISDNIQAYYSEDLDLLYVFCERDGQIRVYETGTLVDTFEGKEPGISYSYFCVYVNEHETETRFYYYLYIEQLGGLHDSASNSAGIFAYPAESFRNYNNLYYTSEVDGSIDVWVKEITEHKVCEVDGTEKELCGWSRYVLFTRTIDDKTDVVLCRGVRK